MRGKKWGIPLTLYSSPYSRSALPWCLWCTLNEVYLKHSISTSHFTAHLKCFSFVFLLCFIACILLSSLCVSRFICTYLFLIVLYFYCGQLLMHLGLGPYMLCCPVGLHMWNCFIYWFLWQIFEIKWWWFWQLRDIVAFSVHVWFQLVLQKRSDMDTVEMQMSRKCRSNVVHRSPYLVTFCFR